MAKIDFTGLMGGENNSQEKQYSFKGLMDAPIIEPEQIKKDDDYVKRVLNSPEEIADEISKRGTLWQQYTADTSLGGRGKTFLTTLALPSKMLESGISNPVIEMQKGNFNPIDLISESIKGFAGFKQGEYGDVATQAGATKPVASSLGLGYSFLIPISLSKLASKLSSVTKFADKAIIKSTSKFIQTTTGAKKVDTGNKIIDSIVNFSKKMKYGEGAMNKVGAKVGAYYDDIGNAQVNQGKFLDELSNMSTSVKKAIADMPAGKITQVDDELINLAEKGNVVSVHKAKEVVDDLINNYFTSANRTQKELKAISSKFNEIIDDAVLKSKIGSIGKSGAEQYVKNFQKVRKDYSVLKNGYGSIIKKLINPQTGQPTQTGYILREISDPYNIDVRQTLGSINKYGTGANKFANDLNEINKSIKFREFAASAIKSAGRGLVIGATAGQILRKTNSDDGGADIVGGR